MAGRCDRRHFRLSPVTCFFYTQDVRNSLASDGVASTQSLTAGLDETATRASVEHHYRRAKSPFEASGPTTASGLAAGVEDEKSRALTAESGTGTVGHPPMAGDNHSGEAIEMEAAFVEGGAGEQGISHGGKGGAAEATRAGDGVAAETTGLEMERASREAAERVYVGEHEIDPLKGKPEENAAAIAVAAAVVDSPYPLVIAAVAAAAAEPPVTFPRHAELTLAQHLEPTLTQQVEPTYAQRVKNTAIQYVKPMFKRHVESTRAQDLEPMEPDHKRVNVESGNHLLEKADNSATGPRGRGLETANKAFRTSVTTQATGAGEAGMRRANSGEPAAANQWEDTAADHRARGEDGAAAAAAAAAAVIVLADKESATSGKTAASERLAPAAAAAAVERAAVAAEATLVPRDEQTPPREKLSDYSLRREELERVQACNATDGPAAGIEKNAAEHNGGVSHHHLEESNHSLGDGEGLERVQVCNPTTARAATGAKKSEHNYYTGESYDILLEGVVGEVLVAVEPERSRSREQGESEQHEQLRGARAAEDQREGMIRRGERGCRHLQEDCLRFAVAAREEPERGRTRIEGTTSKQATAVTVEKSSAAAMVARRRQRHAETKHELSVVEEAVIDAARAVDVIRRDLECARGAANTSAEKPQKKSHAGFRIAELERALAAKEREYTAFREGVQGRLEKLSAALEEEDRESGVQVCV